MKRVALALLLVGCKHNAAPSTVTHPHATVGATLVHSREAFTQGLAFDHGHLYEGTGFVGQSSVRELDPSTGEIVRKVANRTPVFGEGITIFGDKLYQLTWQDHVVVIYDVATLNELSTLPYPFEGWGLTHDSSSLIASDGTATLRFLDPKDLHVVRSIDVAEDGRPVERLNELEYVQGFVWANVWMTSSIVKIDAKTGAVVARLELPDLLPPSARSSDPDDVLNGIAFDDTTGRILVTGKRWPFLYEITVH